MENVDLHLTHLLGWVVNLIGRALLVSTLFGVAGVLVMGPAGLGASGIAFAVQLYIARAPLPVEYPEE